MCLRSVILLLIGQCIGFDIFNIEENCGKSINSFAGELTSKFDSSKYNSKIVGGQCRVTVKLESSLFTSKSHVLFYFTEVNPFPSCNAGNITILDGDKKLAIKGLPRFLCGNHQELEQSDTFFTTLSDRLTVVVNTNDVSSYYGQFNMKYIMFSNGPCHSEHVYKCSNGRCIPNFYRCSSQINACLTTEAVCNRTRDLKVNDSTRDKEPKYLQNLYTFASLVIFGITALCVYRRLKGKPCRSHPNPRPDATNQGRGWGPINIQSNPATDEQVPFSNTSLNEVNTIDTLSVSLDNSLPPEQVISPNRYMLAITYSDHPPLYEDVEDNNDNNGDILPSYGDVVANPTEYTNVSQR